MATKTKRDPALTADVWLTNPEGGVAVEFKAGTPKSALPGWAVAEIRNPYAFDDNVRDERVDFIILLRLEGAGAPVEMRDELRELLRKGAGSDEYETTIAELLRVTADPIECAGAVQSYRENTVERGGETYQQYLGRAAELGADPAPFETFLASGAGMVVERAEGGGETVLRGGETFGQYIERSAMAGFEPVDEADWLTAGPDVPVGAAAPALVEPAQQPVVERISEPGQAKGAVVEHDVARA